MDALLMCGGRGTRLDADVEKPLYPVGGRPMVARVREALDASAVGTTYAVTSPRAPRTRDSLDPPVVDAPGDGYVADLQFALERVSPPVLTVAADLPLLAADAVDAVLAADAVDAVDGSLSVCVPVPVKRRLGVSVDATLPRDSDRTLAPTGVNVVGGVDGDDHAEAESEGDAPRTHVTTDPRLAVNVNRRRDARVAEALLAECDVAADGTCGGGDA